MDGATEIVRTARRTMVIVMDDGITGIIILVAASEAAIRGCDNWRIICTNRFQSFEPTSFVNPP